jgi:Uma2 family endonuclease
MQSIIVAGYGRLPDWLSDHASFRRWATSPDYPERGGFAWLDDELWVDPTSESFHHNLIKGAINATLGTERRTGVSGMSLTSGMMLTNTDARLSTEPDGMFVTDEALHAQRVWLEHGDESQEVMGAPDIVLEVIGHHTAEKDEVLLRRLYLDTGVSEYWLVDSRVAEPGLEILRHHGHAAKYTARRSRDGWVKSDVFANEFRLVRRKVVNGISNFTLEVR